MAKKKRKKQSKKGFEYKLEVYGLILLLASILGIGKFGPVGRMISSIALFLVGSIYMVLLVVFFVVGAYLLIKREWPDFFSTKPDINSVPHRYSNTYIYGCTHRCMQTFRRRSTWHQSF